MMIRLWFWIKNMPRRTKWFFQWLFRRTHISDYALWNLDLKLAKMMLPKIQAFKRMKRMSYPANLLDDSEWDDILSEIEFALKYILAENGIKTRQFEKEHGLIEENWLEFEKRTDEGLRLFGLYFRHLWD